MHFGVCRNAETLGVTNHIQIGFVFRRVYIPPIFIYGLDPVAVVCCTSKLPDSLSGWDAGSQAGFSPSEGLLQFSKLGWKDAILYIGHAMKASNFVNLGDGILGPHNATRSVIPKSLSGWHRGRGLWLQEALAQYRHVQFWHGV